MRFTAIVMFIVLLLVTAKAMGSEVTNIVNQLKRHSAPTAVPAHELAPVIVSLAHFYKVPSSVVASVVLQESGGRAHAYNPVTRDYGIGQLNHRTATQYRLNKACLMQSWQCNLSVTVKLLALTHGNTCLYNIGLYRDVVGIWVQRCAEYNSLLSRNG